MNDLKIETERLALYPLSNEAMRQLIDAEKDETVKQAYSEMLLGCLENPKDRIWHSIWNIELKGKTGIIAGEFCFKGASKNGMVEIGYGLREGFCGNGFMTEAVRAISDWAFAQESVSVIEAETSIENHKSRNVLLNAGFQFSGKFGEEGPRYQLTKNSKFESQKKMNMQDFITPPNHVNFKAKNLFGEMGQIINGSIAYVDLNGGGPTTRHSHAHNHLFIVTEGEARVEFDDETVIIHKDEAYLVQGTRPHSVWNNSDAETVMIGISVK